MIPITIQTNHGPEEIQIPTKWEDVTLRQLVDFIQATETYPLRDGRPDIPASRLLQMFTGIEADAWMRSDSKVVIDCMAHILPLFDGSVEMPHWTDLPPSESITLPDGTVIPTKRRMAETPWGAVESLQTHLQSLPPTVIVEQGYGRLLALYFADFLSEDDVFWEKVSDKHEKLFWETKAIESYPVARFFLQRQLRKNENGKSSLRERWMKMRTRLANLLKRKN
jgi:hypothetical protein